MFDRAVHSSTEDAFRGDPHPASSSSLRRHRVSLGQNIQRGVYIAVMPDAAFRAIPFPDIERQRFDDMPAIIATLAGRIESVDDLKHLSVPGALVSQHGSKRAHADVGDCPCEAMIGNHASDVQVLNGDKVEAAHQACRKLVQEVLPLISDMLLESGDLDADSFPSSTSLTPSCHDPLQPSQFTKRSIKEPRVADHLAIGQCGNAVNTKINSYGATSFGQRFSRLVEAKRDEVSPGRFLGYRHRRGAASERSAPANAKMPETCNAQVSIRGVPFERATGIFGGLPAALLLKVRIPIYLIEKGAEGRLKMAEGLLDRNAGDLVEPGEIRSLFEISEHRRGLDIIDAHLILEPRINANAKHPVVDKAAGTEDTGEHRSLLFARVKTESVSKFHIHNIRLVTYECQPFGKGKGAALPRRIYYDHVA